MIQAGSSEVGKEFASRHADAVFTVQATMEEAVNFYQDVKSRAVQHGRESDEILILPGCNPIVGDKPQQAEEKYQVIANLVIIDEALNYVYLTYRYAVRRDTYIGQ